MSSIALPSDDSTSTVDPQTHRNRLNAQHSTGPTSAEGKRKVSQNAVKHGLTSTRIPSPLESCDFDTLKRELREEHNPITPTQSTIVNELAFIIWKLNQIPKIERELLNTPLPDDIESSSPSSILQPPSAPSDSDLTATAIATHFLFPTPTPLTRIYNHQHRLQARMTSLLRLLADLKKRYHLEQQRQADRDANDERARRNIRLNELEAEMTRKSIEDFHKNHPTTPLSQSTEIHFQSLMQNKPTPIPITNDQFPITPPQLTPPDEPAKLQERLPNPDQP